MPHAIRFHKTGGPEVLQWEEIAVGDPGPGEARIRLKAIGLNYIDTYHRSGLYPLPLPAAIGREGAGVVEAVGPGVTEIKAGDRVAWTTGPLGTYAEVKIHPAERLVKLPDAISFEQARVHDAAGPHGPVPAAPHLSREGGRARSSSTRPPAAWASSPASGRRRWA